MHNVEHVAVIEDWLADDMTAFQPHEQERILDDLERLRDEIETWDRDFRQCVSPLEGLHSRSGHVFRRVVGKDAFRTYFVRRGDTLYCIGCGKRKTTYDRDIDIVARRAEEL